MQKSQYLLHLFACCVFKETKDEKERIIASETNEHNDIKNEERLKLFKQRERKDIEK